MNNQKIMKELKVGKSYRTRDGKHIVTIIKKGPDPIYSFSGAIENATYMWCSDGKFLASKMVNCWDLVEEVEDNCTSSQPDYASDRGNVQVGKQGYEVGQRWKTRDGREVVIYRIDAEGVIWGVMVLTNKPDTWFSDGSYGTPLESGLDLVEPWRDPVEKTVWVALYNDGSVLTYEYLGALTKELIAYYEKHCIGRARVTVKEGQWDE